jgi:glycosyltransferase involved in cell wall biosynthesis
MPPDVALISPYPPPGERHGGHSGVASYTANLAHALAASGAEVTVVAPRSRDAASDHDDGPVAVLRRFDAGRARTLPDAAATAIATGAPVVHLQHELFLYGGSRAVVGLAPALGALRVRRRALVTTLHQIVDPQTVDREFTALHRVAVPPRLARLGLGGVQSAVAGLSNRCVVHERGFAAQVRGAVVVPHGVERRRAGDRAQVRQALGLAPDQLLALCFGFLAPYKGLEVAIDAVRLIQDDVLLAIAGGEHPRLLAAGDDYAGQLRAHADGAPVVFPGRIADADVGRWFAAADVAVFGYPRPFASSGALALALAHDTPVLLSSELAECLGASPTLATTGGPTALADRLRVLAADAAARERLRHASSELALGRDWPSVAARHRAIYEEVGRARSRPLR